MIASILMILLYLAVGAYLAGWLFEGGEEFPLGHKYIWMVVVFWPLLIIGIILLAIF